MTAHGTRDNAIDAIRRGAYDYFTKPFRLEEMEIVIRRALEKRKLHFEIERLRDELATTPGHGWAPSGSRAMSEVMHLIERAAPTDSTVLILGESGVGKELVAEAIHARSSRKHRPFVRLNCAAIPETLLESELFGYERGAFTGAQQRKPGKFELADGGTLLLDEIGDMTLATQAKILRVLQSREVERVGGTDDDPRGRAHHRVHQQGPAAQRPRGPVPRRPVLPAERHHHPGAAVARAPRRDPGASWTSSWPRPTSAWAAPSSARRRTPWRR